MLLSETPLYQFFFLYRAPPMAYGGSQAKGQIGAKLPAYSTATATPDPVDSCDLHHSSRQRPILNPLSWARDGTHIFTDTAWVCYC